MITTTILGGLGNSLFQISMLLAYSLKHKLEYCIPQEITYPHSPDQKQFYSPYLNYCDKPNTLPLYLEEGFTYKKIPYMDNVCFQGYWQTAKYFDEYRIKILKILDIPYMRSTEACSIHVRRTDYLKFPTMHPVITKEYLEQAQIYMMNKGITHFVVVSDDIEWCKESMPQFNDFKYYFLEGTDIEDLSEASSCEYNIGSNSSYSWWIYYLNRNKNKIGVFPKKEKWFGAALPHNVDDLYMPEWVLI